MLVSMQKLGHGVSLNDVKTAIVVQVMKNAMVMENRQVEETAVHTTHILRH